MRLLSRRTCKPAAADYTIFQTSLLPDQVSKKYKLNNEENLRTCLAAS